MAVGEKRISCPVVLICLTCLLPVAGCASGTQRIRLRLQSIDPAERISAILDVVQSDEPALLPDLVDRLGDDDAAVRMYAIIALEKLTGTRLGYSYRAPRYIREARIADWRRYIQRGDDQRRQAPSGPDIDTSAMAGSQPVDGKQPAGDQEE